MMATQVVESGDKVYFGNLPFTLTQEELSGFAMASGTVYVFLNLV